MRPLDEWMALAKNGRQCRFFVGGDILVDLLPCSKRRAVQCKIKRCTAWRGEERGALVGSRGVVTAGHCHTSPLSVEIRSELVRFYLSKNGQKVFLRDGGSQPLAYVGLFYHRRR